MSEYSPLHIYLCSCCNSFKSKSAFLSLGLINVHLHYVSFFAVAECSCVTTLFIFLDFSVHLCLLYYGYSTEKTLLLANRQMPFMRLNSKAFCFLRRNAEFKCESRTVPLSGATFLTTAWIHLQQTYVTGFQSKLCVLIFCSFSKELLLLAHLFTTLVWIEPTSTVGSDSYVWVMNSGAPGTYPLLSQGWP